MRQRCRGRLPPTAVRTAAKATRMRVRATQRQHPQPSRVSTALPFWWQTAHARRLISGMSPQPFRTLSAGHLFRALLTNRPCKQEMKQPTLESPRPYPLTRIPYPRATPRDGSIISADLKRPRGSGTLPPEETTESKPVPEAEKPEGELGPEYDSILGVTSASPQFGLLGETSGRKVALDLNQTHTISLFGVQGGGKELHPRQHRRDGLHGGSGS